MPFTSRLFSICPRIHKRKGKLIASTALGTLILTLGALSRQVVIDPHQKVIRLKRRTFWFFRRAERIPFALVEAVTYGYSGTGGADAWPWGARKTMDAFSVGLRLVGLEEIHLFWFTGEGAFTNYGPFPDWLYWQEYTFDLRGTQESESRAFAETLSRLIGVPIEPARSF